MYTRTCTRSPLHYVWKGGGRKEGKIEHGKTKPGLSTPWLPMLFSSLERRKNTGSREQSLVRSTPMLNKLLDPGKRGGGGGRESKKRKNLGPLSLTTPPPSDRNYVAAGRCDGTLCLLLQLWIGKPVFLFYPRPLLLLGVETERGRRGLQPPTPSGRSPALQCRGLSRVAFAPVAL